MIINMDSHNYERGGFMFAVFIVSLIGCGNRIDESTFLDQYATQYCDNIFSCVSEEDLSTIEEFYGSQEECAADMKADIENNIGETELTYDSKAAKDCIDALSGIECEADPSEYDICTLVYVEPS